jgi:DNA polymerase V
MKISITNADWKKIGDKYELKIFPIAISDNEYPVAGEKISAGFPGYADSFKTDPISIDRILIKKPHSTFIIKVEGESMIDAGIYPNAYIVVDTSQDPRDMNIVVARLYDEFVVKRILIFEDHALLKAENSKRSYPDIRIDDSTDFEIWGVVTGTFMEMK